MGCLKYKENKKIGIANAEVHLWNCLQIAFPAEK